MNWAGMLTLLDKEFQRTRRVFVQTLVTPWISALLYIFIFGYIVGQRIDLISGVRYIDFVLPGIVMMNIIQSSFSQAGFSLYFQRFARHIEEMLVAPFSYLEMIIGFVLGGIARGMLVGLGVYGIAVIFSAANMAHVGLFILYGISVAIIFSCLGLIIGLWAEQFEHLSILNTFVITPLIYVGGVFNSIDMLPPALQTAVKFNPFFYFVDGLRYSMLGISEANAAVGWAVIIGSIIVLGGTVWYLFYKGWKLRN